MMRNKPQSGYLLKVPPRFILMLAFLLPVAGTMAQADLQITEMWMGNSEGSNLSEDWFEITNYGDEAWVSGEDEDLYYDDESQDPADGVLINGITSIQPGASVVVMIGNEGDVEPFMTLWSPDYQLDEVEIGWTDGSGLGGGGDAVTLFLGTPADETVIDYESYEEEPDDGSSYDVVLEGYSVAGEGNEETGTNVAAATIEDNGTQSAIGSPGNMGPVEKEGFDLQITEMWMGNSEGDNLSEDWFEITNFGDDVWVSGEDEDLYYDDESQDPAEGVLINGITEIKPGESVIVMIGDENVVEPFITLWSPDYDLEDVEVGWTDGSGLGGGGDAVTLFLGTPADETVIDYESYEEESPDGASYDVVLSGFSVAGEGSEQIGSNESVATTEDNGTQSAIGSPGNMGSIQKEGFDLQITEMWMGNSEGDNLSADWFEITNFGDESWVSGEDEDLYYDDESQDPADGVLINDITEIKPGASVVVMIGNEDDVAPFITLWSPDYQLDEVEVGWTDGSGLGGGGDAVTLFLGTPSDEAVVDYESYESESPDGASYDVVLAGFSVAEEGTEQTGSNVAAATTEDNGTQSAIGSPGNMGIVLDLGFKFEITEMFPGQSGSDLTADWFEIKNTGSTDWVSGEDEDLYYDDESVSAFDATLIEDISVIPAGGYVIVAIGGFADASGISDVWSPVMDLDGVEVGYTNGSGLSSGGDAVALWVGDPQESDPVAHESYPDTEGNDGKSYDVELNAFSEVGNDNNAVETDAVAGSSGDVPNIASPGNGSPLTSLNETTLSSPLQVYPNPGNGVYHIDHEANNRVLSAEVFNLEGRSLLIEDFDKSTTLDLTGLHGNIFLVKMVTEKGVQMVRVSKNK